MSQQAFCAPSPVGFNRNTKFFPITESRSKQEHVTSNHTHRRCQFVATLDQKQRVAGGGRALSSEELNAYDGMDKAKFRQLASQPGVRMIPMWRKIFSDLHTPVMGYRALVEEGDHTTPSFLLESVYTGERIGRYSLIGAKPVREVLAYGTKTTVIRHERNGKTGPKEEEFECKDPWNVIKEMTKELKPVDVECLPGGESVFCGGFVGYGGYDTMRYAELKSLPFEDAPKDDRGLPDLHFGLYRDVIVFDNVTKLIYVMHWVDLEDSEVKSHTQESLDDLWNRGFLAIENMANAIMSPDLGGSLSQGRVSLNTVAASKEVYPSNMTKTEFMDALDKIRHYIKIGDTFQTVFSQRFERWSKSDPFSVYRALRIINPSPYMIYMQCRGSILVASSPEILTKVEKGVLTNRPLAGTRRRGASDEEDEQLANELLNDPKDKSEHMMLVDLGRNDVGKVSKYGSVTPVQVMKVEKYSHVMHISSTITGELREGLSSWDALRSTLPAGTISGAPKIRSMQIIDELEPTKRGPYGGGIGYISFYDAMNMALALRTMVVPTKPRETKDGKEWQYHVQAGAGIVYESDSEAEYTETVNKAMALMRAIDLGESAF